MKLNIHTANLIKDVAHQIDEAMTCSSCTEYYRMCGYDVNTYIDRHKKAIKQAINNCRKFKRHYNMSNNRLNKVIFKLICTQFVNSEFFSKGEDFDEEQDGLYHPEFDISWKNTLDGYQLYLKPTKEMVAKLEF